MRMELRPLSNKNTAPSNPPAPPPPPPPAPLGPFPADQFTHCPAMPGPAVFAQPGGGKRRRRAAASSGSAPTS
jgi:hypothetical protein